MIARKALVLAVAGLLALPAHASEAASVPSFAALEQSYRIDSSTAPAASLLGAALPAGTPLNLAFAALTNAGADCRQEARSSFAARCLIHQYSLEDGAADDVRWTVRLLAQNSRISRIVISRYVDRHGS